MRSFLLLLCVSSAISGKIIQFSDRANGMYAHMINRNIRWAIMQGYEHRLDVAPRWLNRNVYFEKIRMFLEAFNEGHEWVLWLDDDAYINHADLTIEQWLVGNPNKDIIIAPQSALVFHNVTGRHYFNWGVVLARNTQWTKDMFQYMYSSEKCADLQVKERIGNPEQDCFARFVYNTNIPLVYPFAEVNGNLDQLPIDLDVFGHIAVVENTRFNCVSETYMACSPWFFHLQGRAKDDFEAVFKYGLDHVITTTMNGEHIAAAFRSLRCNVIVIPTHGFGNRLRMMASAYVYATEFGCRFFVDWQVDSHMPTPLEDLFPNQFLTPPPEFETFDPRYTIHSEEWLGTINPFRVPAVVIRGGHTSKPKLTSIDEFNRRKQVFYRFLRPHPDIAKNFINTKGFICLHFRENIHEFDSADRATFEIDSPMSMFLSRLAEIPSSVPIYVASTSSSFKEAVALARPHGEVKWYNGKGSRTDFLVDFYALANCDEIIGAYHSSFSDEAVHVYGKTKECILPRELTEEDLSQYHTFSSITNGVRYINGYQGLENN